MRKIINLIAVFAFILALAFSSVPAMAAPVAFSPDKEPIISINGTAINLLNASAADIEAAAGMPFQREFVWDKNLEANFDSYYLITPTVWFQYNPYLVERGSDRGIVAYFLDETAETPEGFHIGSTRYDLLTMFPDLTYNDVPYLETFSSIYRLDFYKDNEPQPLSLFFSVNLTSERITGIAYATDFKLSQEQMNRAISNDANEIDSSDFYIKLNGASLNLSAVTSAEITAATGKPFAIDRSLKELVGESLADQYGPAYVLEADGFRFVRKSPFTEERYSYDSHGTALDGIELYLGAGAQTARGIKIGSSEAELLSAYPRPDAMAAYLKTDRIYYYKGDLASLEIWVDTETKRVSSVNYHSAIRLTKEEMNAAK